jgi:hypothetical protein
VEGSRWQGPPNPTAGDVESKWITEHIASLQRYAGLWVVVKGRGVRASSDDLEEVLDWLADQKIVDALVTHIPSDVTARRFMLA